MYLPRSITPLAATVKSNHKIGFRLGVNGVFGNMGVAAAPLITGMLLTYGDWRLCFTIPGVFCLAYGVVFAQLKDGDGAGAERPNHLMPLLGNGGGPCRHWRYQRPAADLSLVP